MQIPSIQHHHTDRSKLTDPIVSDRYLPSRYVLGQDAITPDRIPLQQQ